MPGVMVKQQCVFRPKTPSMNATFLQHLSAMDLGVRLNVDEVATTSDPQAFYDAFYALAIGLLDTYYSERTITVTAVAHITSPQTSRPNCGARIG